VDFYKNDDRYSFEASRPQAWISNLRAGINPFTPALLEDLKEE
jgi:hypothetical protein